MSSRPEDASIDLVQELVQSYALNERMNQLLLEQLDPAAWRAHLPGSKVRTIAAIVCHVHNVRRKWIRLSTPHLKVPAALNRTSCTQEQARVAMAESAERCCAMLTDLLSHRTHSGPPNRGAMFHRDGWAKPWPAGAAMVAYMITHEAHHRGQICMLAHQLGFPLTSKVTSAMWAWERLGKRVEGMPDRLPIASKTPLNDAK